jgi:hypothetical protein
VKRNEHQGEEGGDGDQRLVPANLGDGGEHERADQDERGRGGGRGHDADKGSGADGAQKEQSGDDGGDAGAAAGGHAGGGLDVAGDGGGSGERAEDGGRGVGEEDAVEAGDGVVGAMRPARLVTATRVPRLSNRSTKKKTKTISSRPLLSAPRMSSLKAVAASAWKPPGRASSGRGPAAQARAVMVRTPMRMAPRTFLTSRATMRMRPSRGQRGGGVADVAQADEGVGIADDQAGVAKADEGDEEADAAGDGGVKLVGNGAQNHLADAGR